MTNVKIGKLFRYVFIVFLVMILISKSFYVFDLFPNIIGIVGILAILLLGAAIYKTISIWKPENSKLITCIKQLSVKQMLIILTLISLLFKLAFIFIFQIQSIASHPDIAVYVTTAEELASTGISKTYAGYNYSFSHMYAFALFLSPFVKFFGASQTMLSVYLTIISTISMALLFYVTAYRFSKTISFIIFFIFNLLPSNILLPQYITHEHALLFFISISVYLYFYALPKTKSTIAKIIILLFSIISMLLATLMNAAGLIVIIASVILIISGAIEKTSVSGTLAAIGKILAIILILFVGTFAFDSFQISHSSLNNNYVKADKVLWTLYVGSNTESTGGRTEEDAITFDEWKPDTTPKEIEAFRKNLLKERYKSLFSNPSKLIQLIKGKLVRIWSVFSYSTLYTNETIPDVGLQQFYNRYLSKLFILFEYGISIIVAWIGLFCNLKQRKSSADNFYLFIELFLMGYTAMLIITECHNKYTLPMQPFFLIVALVLCCNTKNKNALNHIA